MIRTMFGCFRSPAHAGAAGPKASANAQTMARCMSGLQRQPACGSASPDYSGQVDKKSLRLRLTLCVRRRFERERRRTVSIQAVFQGTFDFFGCLPVVVEVSRAPLSGDAG